MATTAVRSNPVPAGGPTAQQPVQPLVAPADVAALQDMLTPTITKFRDQSVFQWVPLSQQTLSLGTQATIQIANVGLGVLAVTEHVVTINVSNAATAAQTFALGQTFPWCMLTDTTIAINGGATTYTAPGYEGLLVAARPRHSMLAGASRLDALTGGLNPSLVRYAFDATLTPTFLGRGDTYLGPVKSVSVAASTTAKPFTITFYTIEKLAKDYDTLLGALPLQNSSTYATMARTIVGSLTGTGLSTPFSTVGANTTFALASWVANTQYCFASVPSDPSLYQDMIGNSYQVLAQRAIVTNATGPAAFSYGIPSNNYLTALHFVNIDTNGAYVAPLTALTNVKLQYNNGGIVPLQQKIGHQGALEYYMYGEDHQDLPGYLLWDGNATSDSLVMSDAMGWLNTYEVAEPQYVADLATGTAIPVTSTATRESIVTGSVQVIGG